MPVIHPKHVCTLNVEGCTGVPTRRPVWSFVSSCADFFSALRQPRVKNARIYGQSQSRIVALDVSRFNDVACTCTQHHAERLRMSESPLQHMQRLFNGVEGVNEAELRRQLGEWPHDVFFAQVELAVVVYCMI